MGKIVEIPYRNNIIKYITDTIYRNDKKDYSDYIIVFPGKRPSLYVRKYLYEKLHSTFITPILFSMDEFILRAYRGKLNLLKTDINLVWMLYNSIKNDLKEFGFNDEFVVFLPWGYKIANLIEELDIENIDIKDKYYYPQDLPDYVEKIVIDIGKIKEKFHKFIMDKGYITRGMLYADVSTNGNFEYLKTRNTIFGGFFALTNSEKRIIYNLLKGKKVLYVVQRERGDWKHFSKTIDLWKGDNNIEYVTNSEITPDAEIGITSAFDAHSEIVGVSNALSHIKDKNNTSVVLPDSSQLFPLLNIAMDGVDIPYNITMGYPLSRSPLFSLFNIIFLLQENKNNERYYASDLIKLLFHPYVKNIRYSDSNSFVRILFENIRSKIRDEKLYFITKKDIYKLFDKKLLADILSSEEFKVFSLDDIKIVMDKLFTIFIEPFEGTTSLTKLSLAVESVLHFIHEYSSFEEYFLNKKFVTRLLELIDSIKSGEIANENLGDEVVFKVFRKMCEYESVPFVGSPLRPFQIMGLLETRNLQYEKVILMDVNEGVLPSDDSNDPLVPYGLRKVLNLPTYESKLEIYKYYFNRILKTSKFVELLYIKNANKERSRFIEELLWKGEKKRGKIGDSGYVLNEVKFSVSIRKKSSLAVKKNDRIIDKLNSIEYSPSSVDMYLHCPYRFYLNKVIELEEGKELEEEFDSRDIGIFVHKTLEYLFDDKKFLLLLKRYSGNEKMIVKNISFYAEKAFEEKIGKKIGEKILLFETAKMAIEDYIKNFSREVNDDFDVVATESRLRGNIIIGDKEIKLKGFADRIDRFIGRIIINDYKTGGRAKMPLIKKVNELNMNKLDRVSIGKGFPSIQLPLYIYLFNQMQPKYDLENIDAQFIMLKYKLMRDKIKPLFKNGYQNKTEFIEEKFLPVLRFLIGEILDRNVDFVPDPSDSNYCKYCPYKNMCR